MTALACIAVVAAFLAVTLRSQRPEQALALTIGAGVLILAAVTAGVVPLLSSLSTLLSGANVGNEYAAILFKALGVCLITQLAADACRDAGETALAYKAELAGKVALLTLSMPLFEALARLAVALINGQEVSL